jgi:hypothetical protein
MKLTDDHKVQIFCPALTANIQSAVMLAKQSGPVQMPSPVKTAAAQAAEAIALLQSKAWQ